ncbi:MAG: MerR family transcriptional regulator [Methylococcales bacterium]|nr:MerR family transcriptional regulator [Methylococcales bacterium]
MLEKSNNNENFVIPDKRYFTIGEVSDLCDVKQHVLRYWEQEFTELSPLKRRGNRRYYQPHEVLLIKQIKELLYDQGFTIGGAKAYLSRDKIKVSEQANEPLVSSSADLIKEMLAELEELLKLL